MDDYFNAVWSDKPYTLSLEGDKLPVIIPNDVLKLCAKHDMFVLDFLYRSFKKKLNGMILNVEEDLRPQLQISVFLGAIHKALKTKFVTLILCPDDAIIKWHYYMSCSGTFEIKILGPETDPDGINENGGTVLLLSFSNIKLVASFLEHHFFSVVIDRFDEVARKMIIRKLKGSFNIGVTYRNFYMQPNQKLQWTMLNWANPGCVGKLANFYQIDNDNFANFRDNYKEWWFRITWDFCESFVKPTLDEKGKLSNILRAWAKKHSLSKYSLKQNEKTSTMRKRKEKTEILSEESDSDSEENIPKRTKRVYNKSTKKNVKNIIYNKHKTPPLENNQGNNDSDDSSDTIIYENLSHANFSEPVEDNVEPKQQDFNDNASMSSGEQLLFSLVNGENSISDHKSENPIIRHSDDESDIFLKSVATKDNLFANTQRISDLLTEKNLSNSTLTAIDLEMSEQRILETEIPAECDDFLKRIASNNKDALSGIENNNYACMSSSTSDENVS